MTDEQEAPQPAIGKRRRGRPALYKFGKLEVNDSFLVPRDDRHLARAAATAHKKRHAGWNYRSESIDKLTVRFTRTA